MINLAPLKYRNVLVDEGGPIKVISFHKCEIRPNIYGFEAFADLDINIPSSIHSGNKLYGNHAGNGTSLNKEVAIYKAISEALERWAYVELRKVGCREYGFDKESNSSGMAAFPGLTKSVVKRVADYEAQERWAINEWWSGFLPIKEISYNKLKATKCFEVISPLKAKVIILAHKIPGLDLYTYGFSGGGLCNSALEGAEVELMRNIRVLKDIEKCDTDNLKLQEKRFLYFAGSGHKDFFEKVVSSPNEIKCVRPKKIVDTLIKGPWGKYAHVWRVLYDSKIKNHCSDRIDIFRF